MRNFLLILLCSAPAFAQAPAGIPKLIADLGSSHFRTREAATDKLRALGAPALQPLEDSLAKGGPEANRRTELLLAQIRTRLSDEDAIAPKFVSMKVDRASLQSVFDELRKQSGYEFRFSGDSAFRRTIVSVDTGGNVPFWQAVELLCNETGLRIWSVTAAQRPSHQSPVQVPKVTLGGEEAIMKEICENKLEQLKEADQQIRNQRGVLAAQLEAGLGEPAKLQVRLAETGSKLRDVEQQIAVLQDRMIDQYGLPTPTGTITLVLRDGRKPNPNSCANAIRVEAIPMTKLSKFASDRLPIQLRVFPEPGMHWVGIHGIVATNAVDQDGRGLKHDHVGIIPTEFRRQAYSAESYTVRSEASGGVHSGTFALLVHPGGVSTRLARLEGLIRASVWSRAEEVLSVKFSGIDGTDVRASAKDVSLTARFVTEGKSRFLEVELDYAIERVMPHMDLNAIAAAPMSNKNPLKLEQRNMKAAWPRIDGSLALTDAGGKSFVLNEVSNDTCLRQEDGDGIHFTGKFRHSIRPADPKATGAPSKLCFYGMIVKEVAIPFALKNVPVSSGTAADNREAISRKDVSQMR